MGRYRKRSKPLWIVLAVWVVALVVIGWGLWQFAEFRHTLIARAQQPVQAEAAAPRELALTGAAPLATNDQNLIKSQLADDPQDAAPLAPVRGSAKPPADADQRIASAVAALDAGRIVDGRAALNSILGELGDDPRGGEVRQQLADLNAGIFLGSAILPEDSAAKYVDIQHGDSFLKLGREYKVPAAFLEAINPTLNPRNLKLLTGVKIVRGPFNLKLVKHSSRLDLYVRDLYVRSFAATLEDGNTLPRGAYRIKVGTKIDLGERKWIGFEGCDSGTRDAGMGWIYGSAGMRGDETSDRVTGLKVEDGDLQRLYGLLVENDSLLRVYP